MKNAAVNPGGDTVSKHLPRGMAKCGKLKEPPAVEMEEARP